MHVYFTMVVICIPMYISLTFLELLLEFCIVPHVPLSLWFWRIKRLTIKLLVWRDQGRRRARTHANILAIVSLEVCDTYRIWPLCTGFILQIVWSIMDWLIRSITLLWSFSHRCSKYQLEYFFKKWFYENEITQIRDQSVQWELSQNYRNNN